MDGAVRPTRWWAIAVAIVVAAGLGIVVAAGGETPVSGQAWSQAPASSWRPALTALLDRRVAAVRDRNEAAFLADIDQANPDVVRQQRQEYQNLVQLELSTFTLSLTDVPKYVLPSGQDKLPSGYFGIPGGDATVLPRFRAMAELRVTIRYAIAGLDSGVGASPWVPVVGYARGRWVVVAESDDVNRAPGAGGQPWEGGPLSISLGAHVRVVVSKGREARGARLARIAEEGLTQVLRWLPGGWRPMVLIIALDDPRIAQSYFLRLPAGSWAAGAPPIYETVSDWIPGSRYVTSRVVVSPTSATLAYSQLTEVFAHELTHAALGAITTDDTPLWLKEGAANYVSYPVQLAVNTAGVRDLIRQKGVPDKLPGNDFYSNGDNYDYAWLICRLIADRYGPNKLLDFYRHVSGGGDLDRALRETIGRTTAQFTTEWQAYVRDFAR